MKHFFKNKINKINKRLREIEYADMMYGLDAWGTDAFSNIQKMRKLEKEAVKLRIKKAIYRLFI